MFPPLRSTPRRAIKDCVVAGYEIPAGTFVWVSPEYSQLYSPLWTDPERFDPDRFSAERAEDRQHPFLWAPFGGGAHLCLGNHFADMQIKTIMHQVLTRYRWSVAEDYNPDYKYIPFPCPRDRLPLALEKI